LQSAFSGSSTLIASDFTNKSITKTVFGGAVVSAASGAYLGRNATIQDLDQIKTWDVELSQSQVTEMYNSGKPIATSDLTFASNIDAEFLCGDGSNDNVAGNQSYDIQDNTRYIEKVGTGTFGIEQLTINDPILVSASGNYKYVSDTWRAALTGFIQVGNYHRNSTGDNKGMFPDLDSTTGFRTSNNVSYSFWTKFTNTSGFASLYQEHYEINGSYQDFCSFYLSSSYMYIYSTHDTYRRYRYCAIPSDNDWHHVVITTNTADISSGATIYIDGTAVSSTLAGDAQNLIVRSKPVDILNFGGTLYNRLAANGTSTGSNSASGTFVMDEFSTWKKTLSASEVSELWNNGLPTELTNHSAATDLQRWFRFGDTTGDGTAIKDSQETSVELVSFDSQDNTQDH
jgi:hypothetical protein